MVTPSPGDEFDLDLRLERRSARWYASQGPIGRIKPVATEVGCGQTELACIETELVCIETAAGCPETVVGETCVGETCVNTDCYQTCGNTCDTCPGQRGCPDTDSCHQTQCDDGCFGTDGPDCPDQTDDCGDGTQQNCGGDGDDTATCAQTCDSC